jgi:large subunit ribosomal protein L4
MKFKKYKSDFTPGKEEEVSSVVTFEDDKGAQALRDYVVAIQANLRQGNACAKTRAEVSGTGKKPWRQKGTGMARHGSKRSPIWVGGGAAHGPRPRDYSKKLNKKVKKLALQRAFFDASSANKVELVEELSVSSSKTKELNSKVSTLLKEGSVLLVDEYFKDDFVLAARNISKLYMIDVDSVNPWDLLRHEKIVFSDEAFKKLFSHYLFL